MFYNVEDLHFDLKSFLDTSILEQVIQGVKNFKKNAPSNELEKLVLIEKNINIKYLSLPIYISDPVELSEYKENEVVCPNFNAPSKTTLELNNFYLKEETQELNKFRLKIKSLSSSSRQTNKYFGELYSKLNNYKIPISGLITFFNEGAHIASHSHNQRGGVIHILMNNMENGYIEITVKGETKRFSKKGEWFGFDTKNIHSATIVGNKCNLFGLVLHDYINLRKDLR